MIRACTTPLVSLAVPGHGRAAVPAHFLAIPAFQGMYTLSKPRGFENNAIHLFGILSCLNHAQLIKTSAVTLTKAREYLPP